ncbi:MAG: hypothetical protein COZ06_18455 [Armatimonadetes bacterium CG_4_10_14_3_um_filter_66_18]|nr:MAG: hypothetical protein AUJ96_27655 [Armatimonadetes bacterium CG2_30_66_41]PIU94144.1 MAG: hypothetical protein COS65_09190 [Armatimonadetes bacterium CG06_land_8_20_14_3_00_66_21]PIX45445.1 MAG: hypothetical protein COZ57_15325 [Armatimonadetes bacterium CG_4_8_14_3_um_filter_66_20]PIY46531.1 MAG: hypothetical protein COZ06_18455 [Armatimonadetes bacterium CG_4_10_14_3_um_filter_66_18]PIZ40019.1 MAG: hypothetical protein COY42_21835 [Armatimonadetes bacterium CG_4_10_14_0_8_um_filter_66_
MVFLLQVPSPCPAAAQQNDTSETEGVGTSACLAHALAAAPPGRTALCREFNHVATPSCCSLPDAAANPTPSGTPIQADRYANQRGLHL